VSGMQVFMQGGRVLEMCEPVAEMLVGYVWLCCVSLCGVTGRWGAWQVGAGGGAGSEA
jgi:hypothetical protein